MSSWLDALFVFVMGYVVRLAIGFVILATIKRLALQLEIYRPVRFALTPVVWVFLAYDVFVNWLLTLLLIDPPRRLGETVTERMNRYCREGIGVYKVLGELVCGFLNAFDPGHCKDYKG